MRKKYDIKKLAKRLRALENPKTPLYFKKLEIRRDSEAPVEIRYSESSFYRSKGFFSGLSARVGKPISKMFKLEIDDGG